MTTPRRSMSKARRARIFAAHGGRCCLCRGRIRPETKWIVEHLHALGLGGPDSDDNCAPAHVTCAARKTNGTKATTAGSDKNRMAKVKRLTGETPSQWHGDKLKRQWPLRAIEAAKRALPKRKIAGWRKFDGTSVRAGGK